MLTGRSMAVAAMTLLALVTPTRADFVLQFADASGLAVNQYATIQVGQRFDVYVYLLQESPATLVSDEGLIAASFQVDYGTGQARVLDSADVQLNNAFSAVFSTVTLESGGVNVDLFNPDPVFGPPANPNRYLLAKLTFTGVTAGTTQLGFRDLDASADNFLAGNLDAFDSSVNFSRTANLNVVATPEPGSIMLLLVGSGVFIPQVYRRWSRRQYG